MNIALDVIDWWISARIYESMLDHQHARGVSEWLYEYSMIVTYGTILTYGTD